MVSSAWAYVLPVGSNASSTVAGLGATCSDGEWICTLPKGPKENQVYHFSPGYSLWFPIGTMYTPSWQCFKRRPKGQFMHFILHNSCFHPCHNFPGSGKVVSSPPNVINCWLVEVCVNLIPWQGENWTKGKCLAEWPGSQVGCRFLGSTETPALQASSVQLPAQRLIQKTCQFLLSPFFVGKCMAPNLGGLCFTAEVGNILKQSKATGRDQKAYSFDLNPVSGWHSKSLSSVPPADKQNLVLCVN